MHFQRSKKLIIFCALFILLNGKSVFADWVRQGENDFQYLNPSTGQYVVNNWIQSNNGYYFMNGNGLMAKGWLLINDKWYYFSQDGLMQVGYQDIDGKRYYFHPNYGYMVTGWIQENNQNVIDYHYFNLTTGEEIEGWMKENDKWYYFYNYNCLINVWAQVNGNWYHFGKDGSMTTGWYEQDNAFYFLNMATGAMVTGWIQDEFGYKYYLSEINGTLARNTTVMINGYYYAFDAYGRLTQNNNALDNSNYNYQGGPSAIYGLPNNQQNISYFGTGNVAIGMSPLQGNSGNNGNANTSISQQIHTNTPIQAGSTTGPS